LGLYIQIKRLNTVMPRGSWGLSLALACGVLLYPVQTRGDLALGLGLWVDLGALFLSTIKITFNPLQAPLSSLFIFYSDPLVRLYSVAGGRLLRAGVSLASGNVL